MAFGSGQNAINSFTVAVASLRYVFFFSCGCGDAAATLNERDLLVFSGDHHYVWEGQILSVNMVFNAASDESSSSGLKGGVDTMKRNVTPISCALR
jgi:hypothetical protein